MMLKNNMFSCVGKLLVAGLLVAYGNVGYAQSNVQRRADTLMTELVKAETDSLKISYADELGRLLTVLKPADYDLLRPVKYLNYKKSPLTGAEMFSWQVQLTEGAAFYHVFKFGGIRKDVVWRYLPGEQTEIPDYLFYDWLAFKTGKKYSYILFGWSETAKTNRKGLWVVDFAANGKVNFNRRLLRKGNRRTAFLVFEYGKEVNMMLKHDRKGKRIIFDHLSPAESRYADYFMFYGPDGEVNALELRKGEWWFTDKVKIKNTGNELR